MPASSPHHPETAKPAATATTPASCLPCPCRPIPQPTPGSLSPFPVDNSVYSPAFPFTGNNLHQLPIRQALLPDIRTKTPRPSPCPAKQTSLTSRNNDSERHPGHRQHHATIPDIAENQRISRQYHSNRYPIREKTTTPAYRTIMNHPSPRPIKKNRPPRHRNGRLTNIPLLHDNTGKTPARHKKIRNPPRASATPIPGNSDPARTRTTRLAKPSSRPPAQAPRRSSSDKKARA